jgi:hypothetical protein
MMARNFAVILYKPPQTARGVAAPHAIFQISAATRKYEARGVGGAAARKYQV